MLHCHPVRTEDRQGVAGLVRLAIDLGAESGRAKWAEGHIPGAGFADLTDELCDRTSPLLYMMPPAAQFAVQSPTAVPGAHGSVALDIDTKSLVDQQLQKQGISPAVVSTANPATSCQ